MNTKSEIHKSIIDNLTAISQFARGIAVGDNLHDDSAGDPDFDYWHAFSDSIDLNFVTGIIDGDDEKYFTVLKCFAYPVVDGEIVTNPKYEVPVPLDSAVL